MKTPEREKFICTKANAKKNSETVFTEEARAGGVILALRWESHLISN